jgi:hypothetical protein
VRPAQRRPGQQPDRERQVVAQVPAGQPARLEGQPVRPFQPGPLHQRRRPRGDPGGHRDATAAAQVPRAGPDLPEPLDEPFLPGKAQADQDQVGSGGGDGSDRPPHPFVRAVKAERGRVGACDPQAGKPCAQGGGRLVRHARGAAEQIDRPVVGGGRGAQREH